MFIFFALKSLFKSVGNGCKVIILDINKFLGGSVMSKVKWAVVSTGYISHRFVQGMVLVPEAERAAVCSRTLGNAKKFADTYGFGASYDDYEQMLSDVKPDVVYIGTPNHTHLYYVLKAFDLGVNVLCEKPMVDNIGQLEVIINKAREKGLFLMEGMWTRCFPAIRKAKEWIDSGKIGIVRSVRAELGLKGNDANPLWQPWKTTREQAAGALRDVGIYTIAMAFLGIPEKPEKITSSYILKNGADIHNELFMEYSGNRTAYLRSASDMITDHNAAIVGENGMIIIGESFFCPTTATLYLNDGIEIFDQIKAEVFEDDFKSTGFQYEVQHVNNCLAAGMKESDWFTLKESYDICSIIDGLRKEWGVIYDTDI
jgi:predicted dehydrogenase